LATRIIIRYKARVSKENIISLAGTLPEIVSGAIDEEITPDSFSVLSWEAPPNQTKDIRVAISSESPKLDNDKCHSLCEALSYVMPEGFSFFIGVASEVGYGYAFSDD
jgi:hypothetical protein